MSLPSSRARTPAEQAEAADDVVARLGMHPIPEEGGWFVAGPRTPDLNGITVLLADRPDGFSAVHRLAVDEGWQWLAGSPAALLRLRPEGPQALDHLDARRHQALVERGTWMGASTLGDWTLLACWCSPAFRPEHFELGERESLTREYPGFAGEIVALTRPEPVGRMR
jgi:predicted cupin superfamily sugar epimerase